MPQMGIYIYHLEFVNVYGKYNNEGGIPTMAIPVKFYSVTAEEYDRIRQELEQGVDGSEEAEQRKRALEGGIFFVNDTGEIHKE